MVNYILTTNHNLQHKIQFFPSPPVFPLPPFWSTLVNILLSKSHWWIKIFHLIGKLLSIDPNCIEPNWIALYAINNCCSFGIQTPTAVRHWNFLVHGSVVLLFLEVFVLALPLILTYSICMWMVYSVVNILKSIVSCVLKSCYHIYSRVFCFIR